jgi:hypothetical protein
MEKNILSEKTSQEIIESWYKEARGITLEKLSDFLKHLTEDYHHDYGTICHAHAAGGIAAMWAIDHSKQGGITGFQASIIMWLVIKQWHFSNNKTGLKIIDYDDILYPQYKERFEKTITKNTWEKIQQEARRNLEISQVASPAVRNHWGKIVNGEIPFGFVITEE